MRAAPRSHKRALHSRALELFRGSLRVAAATLRRAPPQPAKTSKGYFAADAICGLIGRITGISPSPIAANAAQ